MFLDRLSSRIDGVARWRDYEVRRLWTRCLLFVLDRAGCLLRPAATLDQAGRPLQRILAVRPEHFGDLVLTLPALQHLREAFPAAHITLLVRPEYAEWIASLKIADRVWAVDVPWTRREPERGFRPAASVRVPLAATRRCAEQSARPSHPRTQTTRSGDPGSPASEARPQRPSGAASEFGAVAPPLPPGVRHDLAIVFHGDLRTILLARRHACEVAGYREGGGGFLLAVSGRRDPARFVRQSHLDLVSEVRARYGGLSSAHATEPRLDRDLCRAAEALPAQLGPYLILHPGAGQPSKLWFAERWLQVAQAGRQWGWGIVLTGSQAEFSLCAEIATRLEPEATGPVLNLAGQTSLAELSALVAHARAVVAPDTGIIHLAAALGTPSVALFGPNDPRQWGYASSRHRSLVHPQPCSFCRLGQCPRTDVSRACLRAIDAAEVMTNLQQVVNEERSGKDPRGDSVALPDQPPALSASCR
jgi:ADP-heptose:LPS heptosyltransferase